MFDDPAGRCIGYKQTKKALENNQASLVYLANDCDRKIQREISNVCAFKKVGLCTDYSKKELGKLCGIDVDAALVAVLK